MLSHAAVLAGRPGWIPGITAGIAAIIALSMAIGVRDRRVRLAWAAVLVALAAVWAVAPALLVFLPPAAINVAFGLYFASTLRPGREPRIARFARLERGGALPPDLAVYTRRLTWIWTAVFFGSAVAGLLLAAFAPLVVWSTFANGVSYLVGRVWRFRQYRHAPLPALLQIVLRDGRWPRG